MVPPVRRRRSDSVSGAAASSKPAGLSVQRNSMKRSRTSGATLHAHAEEDGMRLDDDLVITILSRVSGNTADLVRCAATCRRWRRLVSTNAAFICSHAPRPLRSKRFVRFFHLNMAADTAASTTTTAPAPRPLWLGQPLFGGLVRGYGHRLFDASSRVVAASRDGLLAAEIRRTKSGRGALRLRVCNPATGERDFLPWLRGNDSPRPYYACALLTAGDLQHFHDDGTPATTTSYRLVLVYNRRGFTAARSFSSGAGGWGPEARVSGARVGRARLHATRAAVVHHGVVFWPHLRFALLALPPTEIAAATATAAVVKGMSTPSLYDRDESLLWLAPDGRLWWAKVAAATGQAMAGRTEMRLVFRRSHDGDMLCLRDRDGTLNGHWRLQRIIHFYVPDAMPELRAATLTTSVKLRWFYEKSNIVFFTVRIGGHGRGGEERCYTLNLCTYKIDKVLRNGESDEPWGDMYGYELDRLSFLGSLEERGGTQTQLPSA